MKFAQRRNRLTTHFSERIAVVKRHISVQASIAFCSSSSHIATFQSARRYQFQLCTVKEKQQLISHVFDVEFRISGQF